MIISINEALDIPIYLQIHNQIVQGISDGILKPGESLPSVRGLADEIGINAMTVNKAYQQLKLGGYIVTSRRSGAKVAECFGQEAHFSEETKQQLKQIVSEAKLKGITDEEFCQVIKELYGSKKIGG